MSLLKKRKIETSNDYYEAYKAEIGRASEKKRFFSFGNILTVEIAALALGLFLMNQNNISFELKSNTVANNSFLPVSVQSHNQDLVVQLEEEVNMPILEIREDDFQEALDSEFDTNDVYAQNEAMKLLIESLKLEIKNKPELHASNRAIISQN